MAGAHTLGRGNHGFRKLWRKKFSRESCTPRDKNNNKLQSRGGYFLHTLAFIGAALTSANHARTQARSPFPATHTREIPATGERPSQNFLTTRWASCDGALRRESLRESASTIYATEGVTEVFPDSIESVQHRMWHHQLPVTTKSCKKNEKLFWQLFAPTKTGVNCYW